MAKNGLIGLQGLHIAKRDDLGQVEQDSTMKVDGMVKASCEINMVSSSFYCDDAVADTFTSFADGTVTIELLGLSMEEYALLTGATLEKGIVIDDINTVAPNLTMTFRSQMLDGKFRYVCFPLVKAKINGEEFTTKEDGVEIANVTAEFAIIPMDGKWRVRADEGSKELPIGFIDGFLTSFPTEIPGATKATK